MSNQLLSVEEGRKRILDSVPLQARVRSKALKFVSSEKNTMKLQTSDGLLLTFPWQHGQWLRRKFGFDPVMLGKLPESLQKQCWEHLMNEDIELVLKMEGTKVVDIQKATSAEDVDYEKWVDTAIEKLQPQGFSNFFRHSNKFGFGLVLDEAKEPSNRVGDPTQVGVYFSMNGHVQVSPYSLRLACTNGMLREKVSRFKFEVTLEGFETVSKQVIAESRMMISEMNHLTEKKLEDAGSLVGRLSKMHILTGSKVARVTEDLSQLGSDATEYDLIQAITAHQHQANESGNNLSWLAAGGRALTHLHHDHCSKCGVIVA